ncbi:uncharacterized protein [Miscanthus floridulus]|uniref:uncharacterized protein n=1 Tax=Miscanthus floridulus TaxID=154761 RepID=UPI00345912CB
MDGDDSMDPADLYSMDDFLQEQEILDDLGDHIVAEMQSVADVIQGGRNGIYPEWAIFVKSIRAPQSAEHKLFSEHQAGARKDVECAFGILQSRFCILRRPARLYEQGDLENIMLACIILHNMITEDEKDIEDDSFDLNEEATTSTVQPSTITQGHDPAMEEVLQRDTEIRDREAHRQLQSDLIDHIWQKFRNRTN